MKSILSIAFIFTLVLLGTSSAFAQTHRGSVRGTVSDPNGAVVPGIRITLTDIATGAVRTTDSDDDGNYAFVAVAPGQYRLVANDGGRVGFAQREEVIEMLVNQERRIDLDMFISHAPVTVESVSAPVKKDSASIGSVIENRQVEGLPLNGRNFFELSLLVPGAAPAAQGSAGSVRGDFAFSVNGAREDSNNFLLDGVYNVDPKLNTFGVRPPVDAIREFENLTSTYDASFGRSAGAQINVVLKSGTNDFHGSIFEFHRNGALDARNFFAPANEPAPKYIRNQFGFSLGGPIRSDRTFFFSDYEGTRSREGITRVTNVPTLAERNGDFSQSLFGIPINPFTGVPFTNGQIPDAFINPIGRRIAALYPLPNRATPFANFVSSPVQRDRNDHFDVRVDHILNRSSSWAFRYSFGDRDLFEPFAGAGFSLVPGFGNDVTRRSQNAMISETHVFSPALVNDLRFAFNRVASAVRQENQGTSVNQAVGLPELSSNQRDFGLSFISVTGFSPLGHEGNNPQNSVTNTFQILDTATYSRGRHLWKFGGDVRFVQQNAFRDVQSRGLIQFSPFGQITFNALGDLLLGFPLLTGGARVDNHQHLRSNSYNFFVNDSFRVTRNLTLIGGLRYEYNSPPVDAFDRANVYGFDDDKDRFLFFCDALLAAASHLGFRPDAIHAQDWHTAFLLTRLAAMDAAGDDHPWIDAGRVYTIHNLALQGNFDSGFAHHFSIPGSALHAPAGIDPGITYSAMAQGILHADRVNTVSDTYAKEILTPEYGAGLDPLLQARSAVVSGIVNGIDYEEFDPATDPHIKQHYTVDTLDQRAANKRALQEAAGLPVSERSTLFGVVTRLFAQKGIDLVAVAFDSMLANRDAQLAVLGTGDEEVHRMLLQLQEKFPSKVKVWLDFNPPLGQQIYAGCDCFLMPSRYEPCGLNQLYSLRYGTVPIVHDTGGLHDTVEPIDQDVAVGQSVTFRVVASGSALTYQWLRNNQPISGATGSTYTIASAQPAGGT